MASVIDHGSNSFGASGAAWPGPVSSAGHINRSAISRAGTRPASDNYDTAAVANIPSPIVTTPPYWTSSSRPHQRTASNVSADSLPPGAITLRDNENIEGDDRNNACWAKSVEVVDHTVVNGSATNIGAFVVWIIKVETLTVSVAPAKRCMRYGN